MQKPIYGKYKRDEPFFTWQCFKNVNPSVLVVAHQGNSIVGMFGIQRIQTSNNLYGGQLSWLVIAENRQKTGLFAKMGDFALKYMCGLDFIFIFANRKAVHPCKKAFGMDFIGDLHQLVLRTDSLNSCRQYIVEQINYDTKFQNLEYSKEIITFLRVEAYRRWRYAGNTSFNYFKVSIPSGEYTIIKIFNNKNKILGDIVDFECDIFDIDRLKRLFLAASVELKKMGATCISPWAVPGTAFSCLLEEIGFIRSHHCSFMGLKILKATDEHLNSFSKWHLVQSDASNY